MGIATHYLGEAAGSAGAPLPEPMSTPVAA
jgi:hypothetical protein